MRSPPMRLQALLGLAVLACAGAAGADITVFRCVDQGRVTYSDQACENASPVALEPGSAAPDARERLRRAQDLLDRAAVERREALAREAMQRRMEADERAAREAADLAQQAPAPTAYDYPGAYYDPFLPYVAVRPERPRGEERPMRRPQRRVIVVPGPAPEVRLRR